MTLNGIVNKSLFIIKTIMDPIYSVNDIVIFDKTQHTILGVKLRNKKYVYKLSDLSGWYLESELSPVTNPSPTPTPSNSEPIINPTPTPSNSQPAVTPTPSNSEPIINPTPTPSNSEPLSTPTPQPNQDIELYLINKDGVRERKIVDNDIIIQNPISIEAVPNHSTARVYFTLTGAESHSQSEGVAPYALKGDSSGIFNFWTPTVGNYTLSVNTDTKSRMVSFKVESVTTPPPTPPPTTGETWIDVPNFLNTTISANGSRLEGWNLPSFMSGPYLNNSTNEYQDTRYAYQEIIGDSLKAWNIDDDPTRSGTSRAQTTIRLDSPLDVIHLSYDFTLHPDIAHMQSYPDKFHWFSLLEFWALRDDNMTGNVAGSARWTFGIKKDSATDKIYWGLTAEYTQPEEKEYDDLWPLQKNRVVPINFGERATLDFYFKTGDQQTGRIIVTLNGEVLFDVRDYAMYPGRPDLFLRGITFYKLYTSDTILDWMRGQGKEVSVLYHNFKWLKN